MLITHFIAYDKDTSAYWGLDEGDRDQVELRRAACFPLNDRSLFVGYARRIGYPLEQIPTRLILYRVTRSGIVPRPTVSIPKELLA